MHNNNQRKVSNEHGNSKSLIQSSWEYFPFPTHIYVVEFLGCGVLMKLKVLAPNSSCLNQSTILSYSKNDLFPGSQLDDTIKDGDMEGRGIFIVKLINIWCPT